VNEEARAHWGLSRQEKKEYWLPTYVVYIDWLYYCIIAKHNIVPPIKIASRLLISCRIFLCSLTLVLRILYVIPVAQPLTHTHKHIKRLNHCSVSMAFAQWPGSHRVLVWPPSGPCESCFNFNTPETLRAVIIQDCL